MTRRPTIIDVARLAGVSKATAARVLNGDSTLVRPATCERVLQAATQLGYERNAVAGSLRTDQTHIVALSIPDITNPFWPEVARGVQDSLERLGYAALTVNTDWNADREQHYLRLVRRSRFDGLIINPAHVSNDALKSLHIPVVILGSGRYYPDFDSVGSATQDAVVESLTHLYELGHRRIGLCAGHSRHNTERSRYDGYITFHARHGLPLEEDLIIETEFSELAGYDAMLRLMQTPRPPSAVFAANDILAIGALRAAQSLGCDVPGDVSIMGMDDIYAASITSPALTTVAKPKYDIGQRAAELLIARLTGQTSPPQHLQLPCRLVRRGSTAAYTATP
ncbi:MAG: LacI family DNA-binding transcriptional regulator [Chloroflexi bacterium]|nr:LacI family DNA-binding transcriptional regulator [Chloroflexota bacterium]